MQALKYFNFSDLSLESAGHFLYLRGAGQRWPLIEVDQFPPAIYELLDRIKSASEGWDHRDPIRGTLTWLKA
jgi:hypothetical protein